MELQGTEGVVKMPKCQFEKKAFENGNGNGKRMNE